MIDPFSYINTIVHLWTFFLLVPLIENLKKVKKEETQFIEKINTEFT